MATNRICRATTSVPDYLVKKARVQTGQTIEAGDIVYLGALDTDTDLRSNKDVFAISQPATANLGRQMAIIVNGGWETLSDGRRPDGDPNFGNYEFTAGDVVTAILLSPGQAFEVSVNSFTGTVTREHSVHPVNGTFNGAIATSTPSGTYSSFNLLTPSEYRSGGNNGAGFISTVLLQVKEPTA